MQARPSLGSFFKKKNQREYVILISEKFNISGKEYFTRNLPKNVMIGWLGHELGHIMDYKERSHLNLLWFGIRYLFSPDYIKEAEKRADFYAVMNGMEKFIIETKNYILNHSDLPEVYKQRIKKYYLSPEEIMHIVEQRELEQNSLL